MKKLLWPLCTLLVLLTAFGLGLTAAYLAEELTYDQIKNSGCGIPEIAVHTITILHEGDYPGMSDFPVTAEQAAPGRAALNALRGQRYTRILPFQRPGTNGIAVREVSGCSSFYIAYWDGKHLWVSGKEENQWQGYAPSNPDKLQETLKSICDQ